MVRRDCAVSARTGQGSRPVCGSLRVEAAWIRRWLHIRDVPKVCVRGATGSWFVSVDV